MLGGGDFLDLAPGANRTHSPSQFVPRRGTCALARAALSPCARGLIGGGTLWRSAVFRLLVHDLLALGRHCNFAAHLSDDLGRISIHTQTYHAQIRVSGPVAAARSFQRSGQRLGTHGLSRYGHRSWTHGFGSGRAN